MVEESFIRHGMICSPASETRPSMSSARSRDFRSADDYEALAHTVVRVIRIVAIPPRRYRAPMIDPGTIVHGLTQAVDGLKALTSIGKIPQNERDAAGAKLVEVLDEIAKTCVALEGELVRLLAVDFADANLRETRAVLVSMEGGGVRATMSAVRGHCSRIKNIYQRYLDAWFLKLWPNQHTAIQAAFVELSDVDGKMLPLIDWLAALTEYEAHESLNLLDAGNVMAARKRILDARSLVLPVRRQLNQLVATLRDLQSWYVESAVLV